MQAVRQLTLAAAQPEPARPGAIRAAANRMGTALAAWDRDLAAMEARGVPATFAQHVERALAYRARGRTLDALRELDAAATLQPKASDLQVLRALTLEAAGRPDEAGQAFLRAWTLDPGNPVKACYLVERPGAALADRDRARASLRAAYASIGAGAARPASPPFLTLDAIPDTLSQTPAVAPDSATAEGFSLLAAGKYDDAVAVFARANGTATAGDAPLTHFTRGQRAEAQNRVAEARREYQASLAGTLAGRHVVFVALARLAQVESDLPAAIDAFTRAVQLAPNDSNIHKEFAAMYAEASRPDDAFAELMAALLVDPRDAQAHASIGQLHLDAGRGADAVAAFTRALALAPGAYEVRYALATAYTRLGDSATAARQFELFERARRAAQDERRRAIEQEVARPQ
jgi:tetratricopeptide (TPR) repeat protein